MPQTQSGEVNEQIAAVNHPTDETSDQEGSESDLDLEDTSAFR